MSGLFAPPFRIACHEVVEFLLILTSLGIEPERTERFDAVPDLLLDLADTVVLGLLIFVGDDVFAFFVRSCTAASQDLRRLDGYLKEGFVRTLEDEDPRDFSPQELLAWSSVHALASLFVNGPVAKDTAREQKLRLADAVLTEIRPAFAR